MEPKYFDSSASRMAMAASSRTMSSSKRKSSDIAATLPSVVLHVLGHERGRRSGQVWVSPEERDEVKGVGGETRP